MLLESERHFCQKGNYPLLSSLRPRQGLKSVVDVSHIFPEYGLGFDSLPRVRFPTVQD